MNEQPRRYDPPKPREPKPAAPSAPASTERPSRWTPLTTALCCISAVVVAGLVVTLAMLWGQRVEPAQGEAAPPYSAPGSEPDVAGPTSTSAPHVVKPGDFVSIDEDAMFENGLTVTTPPAGDWFENYVENRPDQFEIVSLRGDLRLTVWQTDVMSSPQSDRELSRAQLNRIGDECTEEPTDLGEPDTYELVGADGTRLELLRWRTHDCDGDELWLMERVMPLTGTRVHIVVKSTISVENSKPLMEKLGQVSFTSP